MSWWLEKASVCMEAQGLGSLPAAFKREAGLTVDMLLFTARHPKVNNLPDAYSRLWAVESRGSSSLDSFHLNILAVR